MPKKAKELTDKQLNAIAKSGKAGLFPVGRVAGLSLQIKPPSAASWILRTVIHDKRRNIGLGGYPEVSLAAAREIASALKSRIKHEAYDPVADRKQLKSAAIKEQAKLITFKQAAREYIEKRSKEFKTEQQLRKLTRIMEEYAYPIMGNMMLTDIDLNVIKRVMNQPTIVRVKVDGDMQSIDSTLWHGKTETANRLRIYLTHIFNAAIASGTYTELNPARWEGGLKTILPEPQKISKTKHHTALPVERMPEFWAKLTQCDGMGAKVLQFGILTASRSSEMRGALWSEIDMANKVWRIPAERMKAGKAHNVPLSDEALALLDSMPKESPYIFPSAKGGQVTDATVGKVAKSMGYEVTVHGFRSTFKDWARQPTEYNHDQYDDDLSELALAHVNNDSTRAAYARNELLNERRPMMQAWAQYCQQRIDNVIEIRGAK
ncbi:integrase [Aliidiomarina iranensis]|uniref:Integrase n=1 Tax=Aliidiomarina iranensis TaxID=1434071 RepID=A0A432W0J6_9GAMM|nr:site-specific integrase [Aliidiomarina iranensis]RUO22421.1 integrase [Aliidiomarina iranensis]